MLNLKLNNKYKKQQKPPSSGFCCFTEEPLLSLLVYGDAGTKKKYMLPEEIINEKIWLLEEGNCLKGQFINLCSLNKKRLRRIFISMPVL